MSPSDNSMLSCLYVTSNCVTPSYHKSFRHGGVVTSLEFWHTVVFPVSGSEKEGKEVGKRWNEWASLNFYKCLLPLDERSRYFSSWGRRKVNEERIPFLSAHLIPFITFSRPNHKHTNIFKAFPKLWFEFLGLGRIFPELWNERPNRTAETRERELFRAENFELGSDLTLLLPLLLLASCSYVRVQSYPIPLSESISCTCLQIIRCPHRFQSKMTSWRI